MNIAILIAFCIFYSITSSSSIDNPNRLEEFVSVMKGVDPERYNCSGKTTEEWYATGRKNSFFTFYFLVSGFIFITISVPVLYVMFQPDLIQYPCYKIMFFIGCIDSTELWGTSIWPGLSAAVGSVYCTHPIVTTLVGKVTMVQWLSGTYACVLLGINRFFDLNAGKIAMFNLFDKPYKVRILLLCCFVYGVYGSMCYDTVLYNSLYMAPLLDPVIGDTKFAYSHKLLAFHNTSVCVCLIVVYFGIAVTWLSKKLPTACHRQYQKHIIAQCVMVSMIYSVPAALFVLIYHISQPSAWLIIISDVSYQLSGGLPFIMYIILNRQIRQRIFKFIGNSQCFAKLKINTSSSIWKRQVNSVSA